MLSLGSKFEKITICIYWLVCRSITHILNAFSALKINFGFNCVLQIVCFFLSNEHVFVTLTICQIQSTLLHFIYVNVGDIMVTF